MTRGFFQTRAALTCIIAPVLAASLGACSMAGFPGMKPAAHMQLSSAAAPKPALKKTHIEAPPVEDDAFLPLAYGEAPVARGGVDGLISKYAALYELPESLVRRVVQRESGFNPGARNGPYYGLMQIRHDTARSMGYGGSPAGLLDAETNLKYAVKYLRGAYVVAGYNSDGAVRNYARGYYYDAKKLGLLKEVGFR